MKAEKIFEGTTGVLGFKVKVSKKGPGTKEKLPFYNPAMEFNRDMSILVTQYLVNLIERKSLLLDGLGASGIRGVRIAKEVNGDFEVTINDWNEDAFELIKKNVDYNKLENATGKNENLNKILSECKFDYIDIDPFGSPIYFIDSAIRSIKNDGIIALTATDAATLCGVYPKVCTRRYGAKPFHCKVMHEIGIRILLYVLCREAGKYDKGIEPILSYSTDHYFRIYARIKSGVKNSNDSVKKCYLVNAKDICYTNSNENIGPLWMDKLHNKQIISELRTILSEKTLGTKSSIWKILDVLEEEACAPPFFYTTDELSSVFKRAPPKLEALFEKLKNNGFDVFRTHFSPIGFKTTASRKEIEEIFIETH